MRVHPFFFTLLCVATSCLAQENKPPVDRYPEIMSLIQEKKFPAAMGIVEPLRKEHPENAEIHLFETALLEGMGEFARCEDLAEEYIHKHPDSVNLDQAYYLLGSARVKGGTREAGFESLRKAGEITDDPSLKSQIERMIASILQSTDGIGIQLGGEPPITDREKSRLRDVSLRILRRALRDYRETHSDYPIQLDQLLEGEPPVLLRLPLNPLAPDGRFEYRNTDSGFEIPETAGSNTSPATQD